MFKTLAKTTSTTFIRDDSVQTSLLNAYHRLGEEIEPYCGDVLTCHDEFIESANKYANSLKRFEGSLREMNETSLPSSKQEKILETAKTLMQDEKKRLKQISLESEKLETIRRTISDRVKEIKTRRNQIRELKVYLLGYIQVEIIHHYVKKYPTFFRYSYHLIDF